MLKDVRVISLCHYLQGPAGAQYLADMGADANLDTYLDRDRVAADIARRVSALTLAEAEQALTSNGVWYAPVKNYSELASDPQALHNKVFRKAEVDGREAKSFPIQV